MKRGLRLACLGLVVAAAAALARAGASSADRLPPAEGAGPAAAPAAGPSAPVAPGPGSGSLSVAATRGTGPAAGAHVTVIRAETRQSMSFLLPASGRQALQGLPPGRYHCRARLRGCLPAVADVEVAAGETRDLALAFRGGGRVLGRVVDRRGNAVPQAWVHAVDPQDGGAYGDELATRTDASGAFSIEGVAAGIFDLRVRHELYRAHVRRGLAIGGEGDVLSVDVVLESGRTIAGRVRTEEGDPVPGATVVASNDEVASDTSGADGRFCLHGLGDAPIVAFASAPGYGTARLMNVRPGDTELEFRLPRTASLSGLVEGVPVLDRFSVRLLRFDPDAAQYVPLSAAEFEGGIEAPFALPAVSPGIYRLAVEAPGFEALEVPEIALAPGETRGGLRIRMRPSSARPP